MKNAAHDIRILEIAQEIKDLVGYCPSNIGKSNPAMSYAKYLFFKRTMQEGFTGRCASKFVTPDASSSGALPNYYITKYDKPYYLSVRYGWYVGDKYDIDARPKGKINGSDELLGMFSRMTPESREKLLNQARMSYRVYKQERIKQLKQQITEKSTKV